MSDIKASFAGRRERGERGERGHRGATGPTGPTGPTGGSLPQFEPDRTLFVAQSWPAGVDPTVYFTDIPSAIAQAETLTPPPSLSDGVTIQIYPGSYGDIVMQSGISLVGVAGIPLETAIGNITWTPTGSAGEAIWFQSLIIGSIAIDATGKSGGQSVCISYNCFLNGVSFLGNGPIGGNRSLFQTFNPIVGAGGSFTFDNCLIEWMGGLTASLEFDDGCVAYITGSSTIQAATTPWAINTGSNVFVSGLTLTVPVNVDGTSNANFAGCYLSLFDGSGDPISPILTVAAGGTADVRGSNFNGDANLAGPGSINRSSLTTSFGPTVVGLNPVMFAVPFPDANYNVVLQLTSGPGDPAATIPTFHKLNTGFSINATVAGNTYDIVVTHD